MFGCFQLVDSQYTELAYSWRWWLN